MDRLSELLAAIERGDTAAAVARLAEQPELATDATSNGTTALHLAAEHDRVEIAERLLRCGAAVEARTEWGATPLEWAATMGSRRVGDLLLSAGAQGLTLRVAAGLGRVEDVERLVEMEETAGPDLAAAPARAADEWPPDSARVRGDALSDAMYSAARNGQTETVAYLLRRGADVDAKGFLGGTALHWAAINGHRETVELLLERGASASLRDARFSATPAGWAEEGGHVGIASLLKERNADPLL